MIAKLRPLAVLAVLCLSLAAVRASAQNETEEEHAASFPDRLEQFGRSLVGGNRSGNSSNRAQSQRPTRGQAAQRPQNSDSDARFESDGSTSRTTAAGPQSGARQRTAAAPQRPAYQREAAEVPGSNAPALGAGAPLPKRDAAPRVARSVAAERTADLGTTVNEAVVVRQASPSLSVETVGPRTLSVGRQATYKLIMKNTGEMSAKDVVVTVSVPDFAEIVDAKASGGATEPLADHDGLTWRMSTLSAAGREELALEIVPRKSQPFDLGVRWTHAPSSSLTTVEVREPKLALALDGNKDIAFGDRAVYKLLLSNPGSGDAENVVITLMPLDPADGAPANHTIGVLRAGDSKTIEVELIARQAGHLVIQAEATAAGDIRATLNEEITVRRAALAATVRGPKMQYANTPATYEVHVKNTGNAPAQNVRVTCRLPAQAECLSSSSSGRHVAEQNVVHWTIATLAADADLTLSAKCVLHAAGENRVEASVQADDDLQDSASASTQCEAVADLALDVVDPSGPVPVGGDAVYEVRIRNRGSKSAEAIDAVAYFSTGIEPVSVEGGPHEIKSGMVVLNTIPSLEAGKEIIYKISARADSAGSHRIRVEMNCQTLDTKLTAEETTLFYSDAGDDAK